METKAKLTDYETSNNITEVCYKRFNKQYSKDLLSCNDNVRREMSLKLIRYLCEKFNIPYANVYVMEKPRKKDKSGQTYGYYNVKQMNIYIYNRTAVTEKNISIKSFYNTLLHEFIHHYDHTKLGLSESKHTKGFYMRITDLKNKLS
mgnify:FL=1